MRASGQQGCGEPYAAEQSSARTHLAQDKVRMDVRQVRGSPWDHNGLAREPLPRVPVLTPTAITDGRLQTEGTCTGATALWLCSGEWLRRSR
jgi:hypothetical protein